MTPLAEMIPTMSDADLKTLRANADRLLAHGSIAQKSAAGEIMPLIESETSARAAAAPVKVRKTPMRKPTKAALAKAAKAAAEEEAEAA